MFKMIVFGISLLIAGLSVGCTTAPTDDQLRKADYGFSPNDYEAIVKAFMSNHLKDPMSAQYDFPILGLKKMWAGGGLSGPIKFGWGVCPRINAKNSFGGYTGAEKHFILIKDNEVVMYIEPGIMAEHACNSAW